MLNIRLLLHKYYHITILWKAIAIVSYLVDNNDNNNNRKYLNGTYYVPKTVLNPLYVLNSFNPHNNPMRSVLFSFSFYKCENGGTEGFQKLTQDLKASKCWSWDLNPHRLDLEAVLLKPYTHCLSQKNKQISTAIFQNCVFHK